jgi:hypothetical protein
LSSSQATRAVKKASTAPKAAPQPETLTLRRKSLFKIWNFGVANAKILPCRLHRTEGSQSPKIVIFAVYLTAKIYNLNRLQKSPKIGIFAVNNRKDPQFEQALRVYYRFTKIYGTRPVDKPAQ